MEFFTGLCRARVHRVGLVLRESAFAISRGSAPFNRNDRDQALLIIHIEEDAPVPDAAPISRGLIGQSAHIAGKRILTHLVERAEDAFSLATRRACETFLCGAFDDETPRTGGVHPG